MCKHLSFIAHNPFFLSYYALALCLVVVQLVTCQCKSSWIIEYYFCMNCFIMGLNSIALLFWQELEDPLILIHEKKISNLNAIVKVLELALKVSD
jgi:hypothetical protein